MPTGENHTQVHVDDLEDITLGNGRTPILASFLAGISVLVVGAVAFSAFFVEMQQKNDGQVEEIRQEREEMQMREGSLSSDQEMWMVSFATSDDLNDLEGEGREIVTI